MVGVNCRVTCISETRLADLNYTKKGSEALIVSFCFASFSRLAGWMVVRGLLESAVLRRSAKL